MVLASSRAFRDVGVTSTVRVNMENTPFALVLNRRRSRYRSKLTGSSGVSLGWSRSRDQLLDHQVFGPEPSSATAVGVMNLNSRTFSRVRAATGPLCRKCATGFWLWPMRHHHAKLGGSRCP